MPNSIPPAHEALLQWWDAEGAGIQTRRVTAAEIERFEERYAVTLPQAFRDYLSNASPVENHSWDNELTNWWPFESLETVAKGYEHELSGEVAAYRDKLVLFADYSIWCGGWAINCASGADYGKVAVISGKDRFVAETFDQFVGKYIADDFSVFP
jgi:SMI1 / KNR4 family (SUKH-1)